MNHRRILIFFLCLFSAIFSSGQRIYSPNSVLATGSWYKISVTASGMYKIDVPFLNSLGINTAGLASSSIRLYGNGGEMLSEANAGLWQDDLKENAIQVIDGGDGILNGADYLIFYAQGPDTWGKDSANQRFSHQKNRYSDKAYYFITVGGNGKRIAQAPLVTAQNVVINSFSERIYHELDAVNFLGSGKEWYGEEFANAPGKSLSRQFALTIPNYISNTPIIVQSQVVARSVGNASRFDVSINSQPAGQININATGNGVYDLFAGEAAGVATALSAQSNISINYSYTPGSFNAQGWLNWFELFTRSALSLNGVSQLLFRDWQSVGSNNGEFIIRNANTTTEVWDVTDPMNPLRMQGNFSGSEYRFINSCNRLREYVAFGQNGLLVPTAEGRVSNQNLHNTNPADLIIISHSSLLVQAGQLAQLHQQQNGLRVVVVSTDQVYNEFASGSPDPTALRDFVKMYYDKYGVSIIDKPKYLLLFGDASYDYKTRIANNSNLVPAYQSTISLDPIATYTSDDYFGFLDDNEDINSLIVNNLLDIGIGRVPAKDAAGAKNFVDKVISYLSPQALGPWRNNFTFVADDEDNNLHLQDAEIISATTSATASEFNQQKIYLDAYRQEASPGGSSYPQANEASNNAVYNGTLIWNYNGHGGFSRLAEENILDQQIINNWNNPARLPLFITATCDFAPYDNPQINSLGENILLRPKTGAIALMTTTRLVFAFSNRVMNDNYLRLALQPDANGDYKSLGDAAKEAKNFTYQNAVDIINNRKFTLLGDPALTLAFPVMKVRVTKINNQPVAITDTLNATEKATIEGEITDWQGNLQTNFNGQIYPLVFDKPQLTTTLGNDPGSTIAGFSVQKNILFKGKGSVNNGKFSFSFKVPRDINHQLGSGKISLYANDATIDAGGAFSGFIIGGLTNNPGTDNEGPQIKPYINDELFVNGGVTNQTPVLIVKLSDSSGINTTGTGIGHDIVATLDDDNNQFFVLNDFYQADLNSYQEGTARFQLPTLSPGPHSLKIKAWDTENNSSTVILDFIVAKDESLEISHVLNYPNPFTNNTHFWFEHNKPGQPLQVQVQIMSLTGRTIKRISEVITTEGNRSNTIHWDGRDDFGDRPGRGIYIYI